ncbi:MAG: flagellar biosynthetic protein FliQ [Robiginitomaculum sp.]|nr:flagellar biosynthetic protein FliQ [Robiginitomaculum sp.]
MHIRLWKLWQLRKWPLRQPLPCEIGLWRPIKNFFVCQFRSAIVSEGEILSVLREFLWGAAMMAMPLLAAALIVGLVIGLLQALTSIQEMTLTFVPKLAVMLIVFFISAGYMSRIIVNLFDTQVLPVIAQN